jgi:hypothetical protein
MLVCDKIYNMNPENRQNPDSRDPKTVTELLPDTLQEIILRNVDSELLAARSELIRLQNLRSVGEEVDPDTLHAVNNYVLELEAKSRASRATAPREGEIESVSLLANAIQNVQIARDEATGDIVSQEIILSAEQHLAAVREELFGTIHKE